jgi:hypothetical protein
MIPGMERSYSRRNAAAISTPRPDGAPPPCPSSTSTVTCTGSATPVAYVSCTKARLPHSRVTTCRARKRAM